MNIAGKMSGLTERWRETQHRAKGITLIESTKIRWFLQWSEGEADPCYQRPRVSKLLKEGNQTRVHSNQIVLHFFSLPRHNSSTLLPNELPAKPLSAPLVWVRCGGVIPPLQPLYDGPYAVLCCGPCSFTIQIGSRGEIIAVSHLKACTVADAKPGSPHCQGRPAGPCPGVPATAKPVSFSDPLISTPSPSAPPRDSPGTVFLPGEEVFACLGPAAPSRSPQKRYQSRQRSPPWRLDFWPLLLPAKARAWGEPCGDRSTPLVNGQTSCVYPGTLVQTFVYKLLCTVFSNKLVLS